MHDLVSESGTLETDVRAQLIYVYVKNIYIYIFKYLSVYDGMLYCTCFCLPNSFQKSIGL